MRRTGHVVVWVILLVVALVVGVGGGFLAASVWFVSPPEGDGQGGGEKKQVWTCGMHPQVMEDEPGDCPICHMKLTPMKEADDDESPAPGAPRERKVLYWRAPMDPNYISDSPGKSPMGMDLVPVYAEEAASAVGRTVKIDPVTVQNMGIRTTTVGRGSLIKTIRTLGRVAYDEKTVNFINTKFEGYIEKLHVDETGVLVEKGQALFEVYSPRLWAAQGEYLAALQGVERLSDITLPEIREDTRRLVEAAELQLRYFDVTQEQINELRRTKEPFKTLTIESLARGIVTDKMAQEGMYIKPGMRLYTIADLSRVWVYVDIYEYQLPWVRVGQEARMTLPYVPGREFAGQVVYIYPYLEKQTRVVKVRLEFENPALELKPEMYTNVVLEADLDRDALLIPREAYIDSGTRQVAFVDLGGGKFQPRDIQVGVEAEDGMVEVRYGLDEGERIVTSGQFMLDAESKLKEAIAKMRERQESDEVAERGSDEGEEAGEREHVPGGVPEDVEYACPMETHPDQEDPAEQGAYFSAEPGKCPWCGMDVKPLDELNWVQARLAAGEAEVAYTCPEHPHVFATQSGECPRDGAALEPFKVMYTCPDPEHAGVISAQKGACLEDGRELTPFRGVWLSAEMAEANAAVNPEVAESAAYRCAVHPLVHSDQPGTCPICARDLEGIAGGAVTADPSTKLRAGTAVPPDAKFVCPMDECWHFATEEGECPKCGMDLKPIEEVDWAKRVVAEAGEVPGFVCPMHPRVTSDQRGKCTICGMQFVKAGAVPQPTTAPAAIAVQMDYLMEHYLELQKRFASDRTAEVALHALGMVAAADEIGRHVDDPGVELPATFAEAVDRLRSAALKTNGKDLQADRVTFVELSAAMRALVEQVRPDKQRYPEIYIFHCPMTKGDWLQVSEEMANPFYGFKMLKCGELQVTK